MIVVAALLVLIVIGVVAAGALGASQLNEGMPSARPRFGGMGTAGLVGAVVVGLGVVSVFVGIATVGFSEDPDNGKEPSPTPQTRAVSTTANAPNPDDEAASYDLAVAVPPKGSFAPPAPVVESLRDGDVLRVHAGGFPPHETGRVMQCTGRSCTNRFPVQFDGRGTTRFQYQLVRAGARCGPDDPPCSLVVLASEGLRATARTVFGGRAPPATRVEVEPATSLVADMRVTVRVEGLPPGTRTEVVQCTPPGTSAETCGTPGPVVPLTVGTGGRGTVTMRVSDGPVGRLELPCDHRESCAIAVRTGVSVIVGPIVPIRFAPPPGAVYDGWRLVLCLAAAAALVVLAGSLIRATDWRVPSEGGTPELDAAVLD